MELEKEDGEEEAKGGVLKRKKNIETEAARLEFL
jgi:hypothetical protein